MNKLNVVRFAVVLGFLALGLGAPLATVALNAPSASAASFPSQEPVRPSFPEIPAPPAVTTVVEMPEVVISGTFSKPAAVKRAPKAESRGCSRRPLDQGRGSVTICG